MRNIFLFIFIFISFAGFSQRVSSTHFFYFKSSAQKLSVSEEKKLQLLCDTLFKRNVISVNVIGHTDDTGDEEMNMTLSESRAKNVKEKMISFGIKEEKITMTSLGESNPIETNATEKGKAANRRVELHVVWEEK